SPRCAGRRWRRGPSTTWRCAPPTPSTRWSPPGSGCGRRTKLAGADPLVLHGAAEERRALIASMADEAVAVLARRGGGDAGAHREEIEATLEAASVDASVAALVRSGRLAAPVPRRVGFAGLLDLPLPSAPAPLPDEAEDQRTRDEDVERRREEAARLARAAAEAAADADRARSQLDAAIARVERLEGELAEARARLAAAREEAGQAGARERAAREAAAAANPTGTSEHSSMGGPSSG
ncbi:MAG: hypothetical protein M3Q48_02880, partial [Actinomycetota bacterium]|nr:hypothetical protein [Actinomycetota bacterium]